MNSRERMLIALSNGRPDRLPCQVHNWMDHYLKTVLNGADIWEAYERFDMDFAVYITPAYRYSEKELRNWQVKKTDLGTDADGNRQWKETITTPKGELHQRGAWNHITGWVTEFLIKEPCDFALWDEFCPQPVGIDIQPFQEAKERLKDRGIIRSFPFSPGQGSPWQSFCCLYDVEKSILLAMDEPETLHSILNAILKRTLRAVELLREAPVDLIELGGGAGSSTVISPDMFREFCLPYDQQQVQAFRALGMKTVYHLCGGLMPMLNLVVETGTDGLETMTPRAMGGDCNLREASRRVGDRLFFVGGFDQNAGFEKGTPEKTRQLVRECFEATRDHAGFILSPSDHFFSGDPACLRAFADEAKECRYC